MDYKAVNREGWSRLAAEGCRWTVPVTRGDLARARQILDPEGWIPLDSVSKVLCLAAGGGQQGPLFAALGKKVTVFDLSEEQLARDRQAAEDFGFRIETVQGDMMDLSALYQQNFDLVYQAVSAVYIPDTRHMYREIAQTLRHGGLYFGHHWNPVYLQMPEVDEWLNEAYQIRYPQTLRSPIPQTLWRIDERDVTVPTVAFIHTLGDLIGGLCDAGMVIHRFMESKLGDPTAAPGSFEHLNAYVPSSFSIFAIQHSGQMVRP